jgi:hypothetical protein
MPSQHRILSAVYIFENPKANRVKVGMTIGGTSSVAGRLKDVNDMWQTRKVTCQVCGTRRLAGGRRAFPRHPSSQHGNPCPGSNALPLEKDVSVAEAYLEDLKQRHSERSWKSGRTDIRMIRRLERDIERFRDYVMPEGRFRFAIAFFTANPEGVESLSHKILREHLDERAPLGEVFRCSVEEATRAVEQALRQLGLLHSSTRETRLRPKPKWVASDTQRPAFNDEAFSDEEIADAEDLLRFLRLKR